MIAEEAIQSLQDDWFIALGGQLCVNGDRIDRFRSAMDMAIAAIRAQQEPVKLDRSMWKRCKWCENTGAVILEEHHALHPRRRRGSVLAIYCPNCGRPLTEEAWAELERRINGGKAD